MKKSLIALAALSAFATAAQAQNVTLYGNVDLGVIDSKVKSSSIGHDANDSGSVKSRGLVGNGTTNTLTANALGILVNEDLGGGTKAGLKYETALNGSQADGSAATGTFAGASRESWLELTNESTGGIRIGYQYVHEHTALAGVGIAGSQNLVGTAQNSAGFGKQTRHDMLQYTSPKLGGMANVVVQYGSASVDANLVNNDAASATSTGNTKGKSEVMSLGLDIAQGPLNARLGYRKSELNTNFVGSGTADLAFANHGNHTFFNFGNLVADAAAGNQVTGTLKGDATYVGLNYDVKVAKLFANYADRTYKTSATNRVAVDGENKAKTKSYDVGVQVPVGKVSFFGSIGKADMKISDTGREVDVVEGDFYQLGAVYSLSKRTSVYAVQGQAKIDTTTKDVFSPTAGVKTTTTVVGLRHSF